MLKKHLLLMATLLIATPVLASDNAGLMTYEQFLRIRGLDSSKIEEKNCTPENVLNPRTRDWDSQKTVCELWLGRQVIPEKCTPEQITPAQALKYSDGTQVYRTTREWTEQIMKPDSEKRSGLFMVKQDAKKDPQPDKVTEFKRYVTTGN